jgi:neutral ceramidase
MIVLSSRRVTLMRSARALVFVSAFVGLSSRASGAEDAATFYAGTAKVEITPRADEAVDLLGRPLAARDPLFARVLLLERGETSLAIVSLDLIVFASPKVVAEAKEKWGVDHVLLCATHTHAGMAPRGLLIQPPAKPDWTRGNKAPADWIDWPALSADPWYAATEAKVVAAIGEAKRNRFAARVVTGKGSLESAYMAHNRRLVRDGVATAMWDNPSRRPTKPVDPTVGIIRVEDAAGRPRALAVHYACHPVGLMGAGVVSPDFPGAMCDYLERELGADCMAMFLQGASGDLDPYDLQNLRGENRFNIVKQAGISLAKGALRVSESAALKSERPATLGVKESLLAIPYRDGTRKVEVGIATVVLNGETALVAIPGEPFIQHQLDLAAASPLPKTFVLGLAYHGRGTPFVVYIPTEQAVMEGGYGAAECSFVAANAGATMVREAVESIRSLSMGSKDSNRPR